MNWLDWIVLVGTLAFIAIYGWWKTRGDKDLNSYLKGNSDMKWWAIGLSVMATQASAITFMSTPGQAYDDGMRFVQFYLGLPIAMVILCVTFLPKYYSLKVLTAYEFLENRFDRKTRSLASMLFLIQRGLAAGITIYAPSIILSTILGWGLTTTTFVIGFVVILYTVSGGSQAVSQTQKQQMGVILVGMLSVFFIILSLLPPDLSFGESLTIAGKMGKMNVIDFSFDPSNRYNIWSGLTGGLFLALSYFGTDQSQVARYLNGSSLTESRLGLLFNGLLKIPMQFFILLCGVMVFVFYQFIPAPVFFNKTALDAAKNTTYQQEIAKKEQAYNANFEEKSKEMSQLVTAIKSDNETQIKSSSEQLNKLHADEKLIRNDVKEIIKKAIPSVETRDTDYVFLSFVLKYMPHGIIGLLLAVIFCAAMSSTSSEINALASTSVVDWYKRIYGNTKTDAHYVNASKLLTIGWGLMAISFAIFSSLFDNLIEAVNILGSLFYGTILGIFLVAFYFKRIGGNAVFVAALIAELTVISMFFTLNIGFLWFNVIGCLLVIFFSFVLQLFMGKRTVSV